MKKFSKRILPLQIIFIIIFSMILNFYFLNTKTYATTYTQTKQSGIDAFPESYKQDLKKLLENHPNWTFTAYNTGMSWAQFMEGEKVDKRNTVSSADSLWKAPCGHNAGGSFYCASDSIIEYFADPRNFLTEDGIFQFMEMSYNSSIHAKSGVQSILANTFMSGNVTVSGERIESSVSAKISGDYILAIPEATISEIKSATSLTNYEAKNQNGKEISDNEKAVTGYTLGSTTYTTSYTILVLGDVNGDGQVMATDYAKIKNYIMGQTELTETQKKAADVNNDGQVMATDYAKIKNHIMNGTAISLSAITSKVDTKSYADIIIKAAEESGMSPYSIAIKIIQEVGRNGSSSVSGNYPGYEGYYNFFNWGATDGSNAIEKGLIYAKAQGWNNQYTAIVEGAKKLADGYTSVGQNTAYFYKFDVVDDNSTGLFWHQYMTNIQDPSSQAKTLYNTYAKNNLLDLSLNFVIPVYNNMPSECHLPSGINRNDPSSYYVNGTDVRMRSEPKIESNNIIGTLAKDEVVTVLVENAGESNGYVWTKIQRANGVQGYIANEFLTKCT